MINIQLYTLLESIENLTDMTTDAFNLVLKQYNISEREYQKYQSTKSETKIGISNEDYLESSKEIFSKESREYFTICSKTDFNELTSKKNTHSWAKTLIYHPLNDHSRGLLSKGDILFCYRIGQFDSLSTALEQRGIYGIGIAASNPLELYKNEKGHKKYGIVVSFPILLNSHLQVRNIQMHPKTIDLTPYNGNRNDALQHIPNKRHYSALMSLVIEANYSLKADFEHLLNTNFRNVTLPDMKWKTNEVISPQNQQVIEFDINHLIKSLDEAGLIYSKQILVRFVSSLCTKPFVILTGLSGSGKTQLALNFARWICGYNSPYFGILKKALSSEKIKSNYQIKCLSEKTVEIINTSGSSRKVIPLPTQVIYEWYDAVKSGLLNKGSNPKEVRHIIGEKSVYQKYIHGFYNDLSKIAIAMNEVEITEVSSCIKQYEIVPVGADWTNREPLLGFPNALKSDKYEKPDNGILNLLINANENPDKPFFLILDEMNLSHVERYFSDFLSVMETGEPISLYNDSEIRSQVPAQVTVPTNLFIIGTVNVDETTYMFSPKVLDRANTIEFRVTVDEMNKFLNRDNKLNLSLLNSQGSSMAKSFLNIALNNSSKLKDSAKYNEILLSFFGQLRKTGAEFGYRSVSEIYRLLNQLSIIDNVLYDDEKIDIALMQKLLPKLHGSRRKICPILHALAKLCVTEEIKNIEKEVLIQDSFDFLNTANVKYPLSLEKISRMYRNAIDNGYASYAEA